MRGIDLYAASDRFAPICHPFVRMFEKDQRLSLGVKVSCLVCPTEFSVASSLGNCSLIFLEAGERDSLIFLAITEFHESWVELDSARRARK